MPPKNEVTPLTEYFGSIVDGRPGDRLVNLDRDWTANLLDQSGAILFRGFDVDSSSFAAFTQKFTAEAISHGSSTRPMVDNDQFTRKVDAGTHAIPLHAELAYLPSPPDLLWFRCVVPPSADGETLLCDGRQLFKQLDQRHISFFQKNRLCFSFSWSKDIWQQYFLTEDRALVAKRLAGAKHEFIDDILFVDFLTPALTKGRDGSDVFCNSFLLFSLFDDLKPFMSFEHSSTLPSGFLEEVKVAAKKCSIPVRWQPNDVVFIDNSRVMHARTAFQDTRRTIHSRMGRLAHG